MCLMDSVQLDPNRKDAFAERMLGVMNGAALALMTSVGHRTRLFDTMAEMPPSTSTAIADAAGLNERYVREWLGAMVTGEIIMYDAGEDTYRLPAEHAASLTRAASPNNVATVAQFLPLLGSIEDKVLRCFREGGGVPYSEFPRFQELMKEESDQSVVSALTNTILPLVPGLIQRLEAGIDVLDVGCGSGRAINTMASTFPNSRFVGYDFSPDGIAAARAEAAQAGLTNVRFEVQDVARMEDEGRFDLVTAFDAIHDQAHPARVLRCIAEALRPDGTFLMQDINGTSRLEKDVENPLGPFLYTISCMHCMTVSLAEGGEGLGTMWGMERAKRMLAEAGFSDVEVRDLPHDIQNVYYIAGM